MEEYWTSNSGGTLLGMNRLVREGVTPHVEFMTIRVGETETLLAIYLVRKAGQAVEPIEYRMTHHLENHAVFENPEHGRLSKMTYRREGALLSVSLEGVRGSELYREEILLATSD